MPLLEGQAKAPFYPDDLLPQLQQTLATLADLQLRYEIERDQLESWSGPQKIKDRFLAELEQRHRANREPLVLRLIQARQQAEALKRLPRSGPNH